MKEQTNSSYRLISTEWHSREYVDMSYFIDEANVWIAAAEEVRVTAERVEDEQRVARARRRQEGKEAARRQHQKAGQQEQA